MTIPLLRRMRMKTTGRYLKGWRICDSSLIRKYGIDILVLGRRRNGEGKVRIWKA
jgi:hypothetical protein